MIFWTVAATVSSLLERGQGNMKTCLWEATNRRLLYLKCQLHRGHQLEQQHSQLNSLSDMFMIATATKAFSKYRLDDNTEKPADCRN